MIIFKSRRIKVIISVVVIVTFIFLMPGFVNIQVDQAGFTVKIDAKDSRQASGTAYFTSIGHGNHTIEITKDGFEPITRTITVFPFFFSKITHDFNAKSLRTDLKNNISILLSDDSVVTFCDSFHNAACIHVSANNGFSYDSIKNELLAMYAHDPSIIPVFRHDKSSNSIYVVQQDKYNVTLLSSAGLNKPVFAVESDETVSEGEITSAIRTAIGKDYGQYYIIYSSEKLKSKSTVPNGKIVLYDENDQFGAHD